jgi:ribosomal protein L2
MTIKTYRPSSAAIRFRTTLDNSELSKERPLKRLSAYKQRISGRNNKGHLTIRHRGGRHGKLYRSRLPARQARFRPVASLEYINRSTDSSSGLRGR